MLLAAVLAMMLVASSPAWAQQTSGPATANPSVDAAGAGNVCVQQLQNVNTGNVNQVQTAETVNAQIGVLAAIVGNVEGEQGPQQNRIVQRDIDVDQAQTVEQNITQTQEGIEQVNWAFQLCNQTLNR